VRSYNDAKVEFLYYNSGTKDHEVIASVDDDIIALEKSGIVDDLNRQITKKREEVSELEARREYFLNNFGAYFNETEKVEQSSVA
jgi:hypothetical protein